MSKPKLKPTAGHVLIEPVDIQKKTTSGIYLPDSHGDKPQQGKVLAVGSDEVLDSGTKRAAPCKANDMVIYKKWGGNEVKLDISGKEYLFVEFKDILAIVA
ncbi:co-chaperone GroES [Patescibacteria group bacterium]|nr:co-chaperone GroES [Patescibacteria group bacterium]MBU1931267.1 co-chaperone GroES [Patescibacteria group bacterium]